MAKQGARPHPPADARNIAAAQADYRAGRYAPVEVGHAIRSLAGCSVEHRLDAVSGCQHGLLLTAQLRLLGLSPGAIASRAARGRLFRVHRGVFSLGRSELTRRGEMLAAVLAAGAGSLLAHRSVLEIWGALPQRGAEVHVVAPGRRRNRDLVVFHRSDTLAPGDRAAIANIPMTAPARALLDFATNAEAVELETALNEARSLKLLQPRELDDLRERTRGHHGWGPLGRILDAEREPDFSRKEAERRLLALIREARLPEPRRNVRLHGYEVDMYWPEHGLVAEVDSWAFHSDRQSFERDRAKQTDLQARGIDVMRFTWRQIAYERVWTAARVAERLGRADRSARPARGRPSRSSPSGAGRAW